MNKKQYLAELTGLLSFLDPSERELVISHLSARFEELGEGNEQSLIAELGTPMQLTISLNRNGIESILPSAVDEKIEETVETEETEEVTEETEAVEKIEPVEEEVTEEIEEEVEEIAEETEPTPEPEKADYSETFPELDVVKGISNEVENHEHVHETSVLGAIGFGLLMLIFGVPLALLSVAFVVAIFVPAVIFVNFSIYGISAGFASLGYIPDAMLVFGVAFAAIGITAFLLVMALTITRLVLKAWAFCVAGLFVKLVRKGAKI